MLAEALSIPESEAIERALAFALAVRYLTLHFHGIAQVPKG
jgi:hypothetical protein